MVSFVVLIHDYWTLYTCSFDSCFYNVCDKKTIPLSLHLVFFIWLLVAVTSRCLDTS